MKKTRKFGGKLAQPTQPLVGNDYISRTKEDPKELKRILAIFEWNKHCASSRKLRCEDLMSRRKARTWDAAKKSQMVRRLMTANATIEEADNAIDLIGQRLSQLIEGKSRSPQ